MYQIIKVNGEFTMREVYFTEELPSVPEVQSVLLKDESPTLPVGGDFRRSEDPEIIDQGEITDPEFMERDLLIGGPDTEKKRLPIMTPEEHMVALQWQRSYKAELEKQAAHEKLMDQIAFEVSQLILLVFITVFFAICLYLGST